MHKSEVHETFKKWLAMAERQTICKLNVLISDNGGEHTSNEMKKFMLRNGNVSRLAAPYNPFQNGAAERLNRTPCDLVRSMLISKSVSKSFWAEAPSVAVHDRYRDTTHGLASTTTLHELLLKRLTSVENFRIFGCRY